MTCFINLLLRSIQYYSIYYGFTYLYVDIEGYIVKLSKFIKLYTNIVNLIYAVVSIYFFRRKIKFLIFHGDVLSYFYILVYLIELYIFTRLLMLNLHLEKALKKWLKVYSQLLINLQLDKQPLLSINKISKFCQILTIVLIYMLGIYNAHAIFTNLRYEEWYDVLNDSMFHYFAILENYVMLQHSFIVSYIANCFSRLNFLKRNRQICKDFGRIYYELSLVLKEVNILNGPCVLGVLLSQIIQIALNVINMFENILVMNTMNDIYFMDLITPGITMIQSTNIFLYFTICNRIYWTTEETGRIIREYYVDQENLEVCTHLNVKLFIH